MTVDPAAVPPSERCNMQVVEGGEAIRLFLGSDMLRKASKWATGAVHEWDESPEEPE